MIGAIIIGLAAGVVAGLLGVGGGVLFVPGLVLFLGLDQHHAEATSLLAIVPVAIVGTYRHDRYGNVRRADALTLGMLSLAGAAGGVALANALSGAVLRYAFAAVDGARGGAAGVPGIACGANSGRWRQSNGELGRTDVGKVTRKVVDFSYGTR